MRISFALWLVFASQMTLAAEGNPITEVRVYRAGATPSLIAIEKLPQQIRVRSRAPHRQLNPEGKVVEFEGAPLRTLLNLAPKDKDLLVHFVAADGYISTVPASVLLKTDAILALKESGQPIDTHRGGLQVIYPTEGKNAVEEAYAKKAAFWCWYVRSIVIGDLTNHLAITKVSLRGLAKQAEAFSYEPPSVFQFKTLECPKRFRIPLSSVTKAQAVTLNFLSGKTKQALSANFDLIFSAQAKAIPVICGGPFALADRSKVAAISSRVFAKDIEANIISIEESK